MVEETRVDGWRAVASWINTDEPTVSVELDRNLGGMWPKVILTATAREAEHTAILVGPAPPNDSEITGVHGFVYRAGIADECISAIASGVSEALGDHRGVEVHVSTGGVAVDIAELVSRYAAHVATRLLLGKLRNQERSLESSLAAATPAA